MASIFSYGAGRLQVTWTDVFPIEAGSLAEEMAELVKCVLGKHKGLSLILKTQLYIREWPGNLVTQQQGGRNKQIPRELPSPASLSHLVRDPVSTLTKTGDGS